jgi:carbonic anhydrase/acetyltransferase-like protein (isoleucine patch superfamily)
VVITESNLDDDVEVREGAYVSRAQVRDGAIIGRDARIRNAVVGSMSEVQSEPGRATVLEDFVALGDEVVVHPGARLAGDISVYPRLKIPAGISVPAGTELASAQEVIDLL